MLNLAKGLRLPIDVVTETVAILAKRRAGKSTTARRLTEQLHAAKQQVAVVDPKGDWWGLLFARDGKAPGLPFVVLGGEHGHIPLEVGAGEIVARLVVTERVNVVLDLSQFRKHEVATFMTAFMETLYRLKAQEHYRTPMMLVVDEADAIAPQRPMRGEERMLGAAEDLVRRGGQRGIGVTMITQRPAVLNKNVLTQAQVLIVLRLIAPQDVAAMDEWIKLHGSREQRSTLMESLPSLPTGTGWVWAPGWPDEAGIFHRCDFLLPETFDSSKTPGQSKVVVPKHAADVDLAAFQKEMAATIQRAKADDPRELRKRIAELERELKGVGAIARKEAPPKTIEKPVVTDAQLKRIEAIAGRMQELHARLHGLVDALFATTHPLSRAVQAPSLSSQAPTRGSGVPPLVAAASRAHNATTSGPRAVAGSSPASGPHNLDGPQRAILNTVRMLDERGLTPNRDMVARWLGIHPNGGRYGSNLARLRELGLLDGAQLTTAGCELAEAVFATGINACLGPLDGSQRQIVELLHRDNRTVYTRETLAEALGIHPNGGRYGSNLARLRTMGLIPERGPIQLTEGAYR